MLHDGAMSGVSIQRDTERQKRQRERESFRNLFLSLAIAFCLGLLVLLLVKSSVVGSVLFFPVFFSSLALLCTFLYMCLCVCMWFCSQGNFSTRCEDLCQNLGETQKSNLNAREGVLFRWCVWVLNPHPPVSSLFSSFSFFSLFVCCVLKRVFGFLGV